jgi:phage tail sheath protein FI
MGFQLSPGVEIKEFDFTNIIPAVSASAGAYAGRFVWGPVDEILTISSENELKSVFGKPTDDNAAGWFAAANFLSYGNNLKVVRVVDESTALNAGASGVDGVTGYIANEQAWENSTQSVGFLAKYPGALGNAIAVYAYSLAEDHLETTGTDLYTDTELRFSDIFDRAPNSVEGLGADQLTGGSAWAHDNGVYGDEINLCIIDRTGAISGVANTVLEKFEGVSLFPDAKKPDGASNYIRTVINNGSQYIWMGKEFTISGETIDDAISLATKTPATIAGAVPTDGHRLTGGSDGSAPAGGDYFTSDGTRGYGLFLDAEQVDISLLLLGAPVGSAADATGIHTTLAKDIVQQIAEKRKDCVAFVSAPYTNIFDQANAGLVTDRLIEWRNAPAGATYSQTKFNVSSSYAVIDSGWKYQYDPYNDKYRWVPLNGDTAGLCAQTDSDRDPWYSPAGYNRGQIKRVVKLAYNPNKTQRDELYQAGINPVVAFPGQGTVLFGDKTALAKPSAFDRINVRRLFIVLEKAIATASKFQLFEFNDEFTRASFVSLVEPFLRDVQGRRGLIDFKVVCDATNNTPEVIDSNRFVADIFIKPARSINFITLNFVATRTGVDFSEVAGGF